VLSLSCGFQAHNLLVQCARDPIVALTGQIGWPVSIVTRAGQRMVTRDSTVALTSLTFSVFQPGIAMPIFGSASGELCFAYSTAEQQREMLAHVEAAYGDPLAIAGFRSGERSALIRRAGYAIGTRNPQIDGGGRTTSLATPILVDDQFVGALVLVFFASALTPAEAIRRYFPILRDTCAGIANAVAYATR
jgi:IclR family mhp operon transcriptional activator